MNKNTTRRQKKIRREALANKILGIQSIRREAVKNTPMKPVRIS